MTPNTSKTIEEIIKLFRQCEKEKWRWGDNRVDLEYFIDWLEAQLEKEKQ